MIHFSQSVTTAGQREQLKKKISLLLFSDTSSKATSSAILRVIVAGE